MANNKVVLADGSVLIDLTSDTVTAQTLVKGYIAHNAAGNVIVGEYEGSSTGIVITGQKDANGSLQIYINGQVKEAESVDVAGGTIKDITADVLLDISQDTIDPSKLMKGYTAHDSMGRPIVGTLEVDTTPMKIKLMFEQDDDGYIVMSDQDYITSAVGVKF